MQVSAIWPCAAVVGLDELSANSEVEHDRDEHVDGHGPETSRGETPLSNGRHSFLIEADCVQRANDADLRTCTRRS